MTETSFVISGKATNGPAFMITRVERVERELFVDFALCDEEGDGPPIRFACELEWCEADQGVGLAEGYAIHCATDVPDNVYDAICWDVLGALIVQEARP